MTTARSTPSRPKSSSAWLIPFDVSTPAHAARNPTRRTGSCRACAAASVSSRSHAKTVLGSVKTIPSRNHHSRSRELWVASACVLTSSSLVKLELGKRAACDPLLQVVPGRGEQPSEDLSPLGGVLDRLRPRGQVGRLAALHVHDELGIRLQVRVPVALPRRAGQVDAVVCDPSPDLDPLRPAAARAGRGDVDRAVAEQRVRDLHQAATAAAGSSSRRNWPVYEPSTAATSSGVPVAI